MKKNKKQRLGYLLVKNINWKKEWKISIVWISHIPFRIGSFDFFKINQRFAQEMIDLMQHEGYQYIELKKDSYGNDRILLARFD